MQENELAHCLWKPETALPVDPFEMALVASMASEVSAALLHQMPDHDPHTHTPPFPEKIYQQVLIELRDLYSDEQPEKIVSICWRLFSLYKLIQADYLNEWVDRRSSPILVQIPAAIIFVAATLPLNGRQGFDPPAFVHAVRQSKAPPKKPLYRR